MLPGCVVAEYLAGAGRAHYLFTLAYRLGVRSMWGWLIGFLSSDVAGRGGASIYGKQFEDELHPDLKFTGKCIIWLGWVGRESGF